VNIDELLRAVEAGKAFEYVYFWGHTGEGIGKHVLSQWYRCSFVVDGTAYNSAEQFMMAEKARLMGDEDARAKMLASSDPGEIKALGRAVKNYDGALWDRERFDVVVRGNVAKFSNAPLRAWLLGTGESVLVEASPKDAIWGIGLDEHDERAKDPRRWKGANLLGFAIMNARAALK
jgi:ribA/ribD-fused uncharacterized protein